jgi:hypothetical protein
MPFRTRLPAGCPFQRGDPSPGAGHAARLSSSGYPCPNGSSNPGPGSERRAAGDTESCPAAHGDTGWRWNGGRDRVRGSFSTGGSRRQSTAVGGYSWDLAPTSLQNHFFRLPVFGWMEEPARLSWIRRIIRRSVRQVRSSRAYLAAGGWRYWSPRRLFSCSSMMGRPFERFWELHGYTLAGDLPI